MNYRIVALASALIMLAGVGLAIWLCLRDPAERQEAALPVPPFPPRIADGRDYETCLAALDDDPAGAVVLAETLQQTGSSDGATHCRGLALITLGRPDAGAAVLEQLGQTSSAPALARAFVLGQAGQARLMAGQPDKTTADLSRALVLAPDDPGLLIMRAQAQETLRHYADAEADLNQALKADEASTEALVARAELRRKMGQLAAAQADVTRALALKPDDPDALLERGILRQRLGDQDGARQDWQHAMDIDPNSVTADLAQQNLSLLEAGPAAR